MPVTMTPQTQFYKGAVKIGGRYYPVYPGYQLNLPDNWFIPPIVGNFGHLNYGNGYIQPTIEFSFVVRKDHASQPSVLEYTAGSLLKNLIDRTSDAAHDTYAYNTTPGTPLPLKFWDGRNGWQANSFKVDYVRISGSKGQPISVVAGLCAFSNDHATPIQEIVASGATGSQINYATAFSDLVAWNTTGLMMFDNVNFYSGAGADLQGLTNAVWAFSLTISNQHTPDGALDNTRFPRDCNAGQLVSSLSLTVQAADAIPADGTTFMLKLTDPAGVNTSFLFNNPLCLNRNTRPVQAPRVMRQYAYDLLWADAQTTAPVTITSTF